MSVSFFAVVAAVVQVLLPPPPSSPSPSPPLQPRAATISVSVNPKLDRANSLQFSVTVHNTEKRAYCIAYPAFPNGRQEGPMPITVFDSEGDTLEFHGPLSGFGDPEGPTIYVAIPPGKAVTHIISVGNDYKFPTRPDRYVAEFSAAGIYCDDLNSGYPISAGHKPWPGASLLFHARSKPFAR